MVQKLARYNEYSVFFPLVTWCGYVNCLVFAPDSVRSLNDCTDLVEILPFFPRKFDTVKPFFAVSKTLLVRIIIICVVCGVVSLQRKCFMLGCFIRN